MRFPVFKLAVGAVTASALTIAAITLWWYKINPHRSYVKGWKIAPSHYLGQQLDQVWLDK